MAPTTSTRGAKSSTDVSSRMESAQAPHLGAVGRSRQGSTADGGSSGVADGHRTPRRGQEPAAVGQPQASHLAGRGRRAVAPVGERVPLANEERPVRQFDEFRTEATAAAFCSVNCGLEPVRPSCSSEPLRRPERRCRSRRRVAPRGDRRGVHLVGDREVLIGDGAIGILAKRRVRDCGSVTRQAGCAFLIVASARSARAAGGPPADPHLRWYTEPTSHPGDGATAEPDVYARALLARSFSAPLTLSRSRPCPPCQSRHITVASSLSTLPVASRTTSARARTASRGCSDLVWTIVAGRSTETALRSSMPSVTRTNRSPGWRPRWLVRYVASRNRPSGRSTGRASALAYGPRTR